MTTSLLTSGVAGVNGRVGPEVVVPPGCTPPPGGVITGGLTTGGVVTGGVVTGEFWFLLEQDLFPTLLFPNSTYFHYHQDNNHQPLSHQFME